MTTPMTIEAVMLISTTLIKISVITLPLSETVYHLLYLVDLPFGKLFSVCKGCKETGQRAAEILFNKLVRFYCGNFLLGNNG